MLFIIIIINIILLLLFNWKRFIDFINTRIMQLIRKNVCKIIIMTTMTKIFILLLSWSLSVFVLTAQWF